MVSKDDDIKVFHLDLPARTEDIARAKEVADRVRIGHRLGSEVRDLSHGQRRQLEFGMALAADPIKVWHHGGRGDGERERMEALIKEWNAANPDIPAVLGVEPAQEFARQERDVPEAVRQVIAL